MVITVYLCSCALLRAQGKVEDAIAGAPDIASPTAVDLTEVLSYPPPSARPARLSPRPRPPPERDRPRARAPARPRPTRADLIELPRWTLPNATRSAAMRFSIVQAIDGLAYKCQGTGARIERDVFAPNASSAVSVVHGHAPWMSTGSFCGFYFCDFEFMPEVIATVATHRGYGIFVVPMAPTEKPALSVPRKVLGADGVKRATRVRYGWYNYLLSHSRLVMDLPPDALVDRRTGAPLRFPFKMRAVLAQFGANGQFKAAPRKEKLFQLKRVPALDGDGPKLAVRPALPHMVSPLAHDSIPTKRDDVSPASPPFPPAPASPAPTPLRSRWTPVLGELRALAADYPCQEVAHLALEVATDGLDPFKGILDKTVVHRAPSAGVACEVAAARDATMKEVALGRIAGPFNACPYVHARVCPTSVREKDPYDPNSTRLRLISDFSRRSTGCTTGSINDLCYSPRLLSYHALPAHIRDDLAWRHLCFGPGIQAWTADVPACFRLNHLHARLLSLFVYKIVTVAFGTEWFVELATPFGFTPAEWGWQCILALTLWALRSAGLPTAFAYVDNYFLLAHPEAGDDVTAMFAAAEDVFKRLHIPLHERMVGTWFKGLGWFWDTSPTNAPPLMVCAQDKFDHLCRKLPVWAAATSLPFKEVESIVGFLAWISAGFPIGRAHLAYLRANLLSHSNKYRGSVPERFQSVRLGVESLRAIAFWHHFFPSWDRRCPVFLDFGPMAPAQVLWRVDASTEWGMGAVMWKVGSVTAHYIEHKWTSEDRKHAFVVKRESTGVMEAIGAALCAVAFAPKCRDQRVLLETDNTSVARGIRRAYTRTANMMGHIQVVCETAAKYGICLRAAHIKGKYRPPARTCTPLLFSVLFSPLTVATGNDDDVPRVLLVSNSALDSMRRVSVCACAATARSFHVCIWRTYQLVACMCAGDWFNKIADHLSHHRVAEARACAASDLGATLRRMPLHRA